MDHGRVYEGLRLIGFVTNAPSAETSTEPRRGGAKPSVPAAFQWEIGKGF
ncbi:MAG: hypothetical protein HC806_09050 [Anaerolineae bacterium]|nr:hypothetical protein [Anaerolineae bacterium]